MRRKETKDQDTRRRANNSTHTMVRGEIAHDIFVHHMVSAEASRRPDAVAIVSGQNRLSYGELNSRANKLAQYFHAMKIGPEDVVALWMTRSPWLIVAALAALKTGAAYLPMDPANPCDRLFFMVKDSGAKVVVTEGGLAGGAGQAPCPVLSIDRAWEGIESQKEQTPDVELRFDALAYVIYTSGSTGVPKGVEITHANLANLISWHNRAFRVTHADHASHLAGLGFDASVWETWPYLASGASLRLADSGTLTSPEQLRSWLVANGITIGFLPAPLADRMVDAPWPEATRLRLLLTGGDTLHARPIPGLPFRLVNNYGPTECAVVATWSVVSPCSSRGDLPAIGVPIDNTHVYIMDESLQPVPEGTAGELYVGGANVGRGYRNRADLTAERFIPNPFMPGAKLYKTGDLGRRLPDGQIAFLGRVDNQIKIRGYRIEPGEIAATMNAHPAVSASIVVAQSGSGEDKRLVGYLVADRDLKRTELQQFLLQRLPDYMVPSTFVVLDSLPLTANGKVDCGALPRPAAENTLRDEPSATSSVTETTVAHIVSELLHVSEIGPTDDFFLLGGHSLLGTQLIARIREAFDIEVPLRTLFQQPTVRELAAEIERLVVTNVEEIREDRVQSGPDVAAETTAAELPPPFPQTT